MQALEPNVYSRPAKYGSVFHWHEDRTSYRPEHLATWTDREVLIKHYHLTARLDGYNHTKGDPEIVETTKDNCIVFREELARRGIDGVKHCQKMDWAYDAGYRTVQVFYPRLLTRPEPHQ